ncbi:MAG: hypothetical protein FWE74_01325 [Oscillospiraceae bacterium]|nr:hypothetical protein [Oscillospiraceae bacterium]
MISRIARINSDFLKYALYRVYSLKSQITIMIICGILSFPLITFALSLDLNAEKTGVYNDGTASFLIVSMFLCIVAGTVFMLLVYTGGVNCYDYYNRRERVDLSWSLPVKNRDRFWGDFASGLAPLALTYTISAVIGLFIIRFGFPADTFYDYPYAMAVIAAAMFIGLLTIISVYIISVFCAAICGRVYETVVYPAMIMIIIPAIIGLFGTMIFNNVWQISIYEQLETVLAGTSPGGFLVVSISELAHFMSRFHNEAALSEYLTFLNPAIIIPFILINGGFLAGAYYLAKRRGAEKTGNSFVFRGALEIIMSLVVFCIASLFFIGNMNHNAGTVFGLVMTTAVAFLVLDVSAKRGFKKMGRAFLKYACMLTGSVIIANVLLAADGFGIGRYVPQSVDIESVTFEVQFLDSQQFGHQRRGWYTSYGGEPVEFKDREAIELIRQIHIESNENKRNYDSFGYVYYGEEHRYDFSHNESSRRQQPVTYTLNNGSTVTRNVRLTLSQIERLLSLIMTDDYKFAQVGSIDDWFSGKEAVEAAAELFTLAGEQAGSTSRLADAMSIYEALRADYLAETFEQRFYSSEKVIGILSLGFDEKVQLFPDTKDRNYYRVNSTGLNVYVFAHYTNLIAELERQGFGLSGGAEESWLHAGMSILKAHYIGADMDTAEYEWNTWAEFNSYESMNERTSELILMLADVMQPSHIVKGEGYIVSINTGRLGRYFVIPPEYNHIAAELHELAEQAQRLWQIEQQQKGGHYWGEEYYETEYHAAM